MSAQCWEPGSEWALAAAKQSLVSRFLVVGVTEQFESFIEVSEVIIIFPLLIIIFIPSHISVTKRHVMLSSILISRHLDKVDTAEASLSRPWSLELYLKTLSSYYLHHRGSCSLVMEVSL